MFYSNNKMIFLRISINTKWNNKTLHINGHHLFIQDHILHSIFRLNTNEQHFCILYYSRLHSFYVTFHFLQSFSADECSICTIRLLAFFSSSSLLFNAMLWQVWGRDIKLCFCYSKRKTNNFTFCISFLK